VTTAASTLPRSTAAADPDCADIARRQPMLQQKIVDQQMRRGARRRHSDRRSFQILYAMNRAGFLRRHHHGHTRIMQHERERL